MTLFQAQEAPGGVHKVGPILRTRLFAIFFGKKKKNLKSYASMAYRSRWSAKRIWNTNLQTEVTGFICAP